MSQKLQPLYNNGERVPDYYFDEKTKMIYFLKSMDGKKVKFSTGAKVPNIVTAKRNASAKLKAKLNAKKMSSRTLIREELGHWLVVKESEGLAYDSMNNIRRAKGQIEEFWGGKFPHEITRDNLTAWYSYWREKHPDIEMENAIKYMRNFCRYLAQKIVDDRPLLPIVPTMADPNYKKIRRARKKKKERVFTAAEFKTIYEGAPNPEAALCVLIMHTMATRITETLSSAFGDEFILKGSRWVYKWSDGQNKADHDGWHFAHPALDKYLSRLQGIRAGEHTKLLFPQLHDRRAPLKEQQIDWAGWRKRANLGWHWTPHTFRHTCLTNLFNNPKNPQGMICKLYRVSLAVAMETYIHPTDESRMQMRDVIEIEI